MHSSRYGTISSNQIPRSAASEDRPPMPDRKSFQEQIPDWSPGGRARGWAPGSKCLAWQSKWNSNPSPGVTPAATKEYLKVLRQAPRTRWQWAQARQPFCTGQRLPLLSQLITQPPASGTKYYHATDGNWMTLIGPSNSLMIEHSGAKERGEKNCL